MFEKKLIVKNETGLHARPASDLTVLCQKFDSEILILASEAEVNPKSIISILAGGIGKGCNIKLQVVGSDELEAGEAIVAFIENLTD